MGASRSRMSIASHFQTTPSVPSASLETLVSVPISISFTFVRVSFNVPVARLYNNKCDLFYSRMTSGDRYRTRRPLVVVDVTNQTWLTVFTSVRLRCFRTSRALYITCTSRRGRTSRCLTTPRHSSPSAAWCARSMTSAPAP